MRVLEIIPDESFEAKSCKDSLRRALRDVWTECNGKLGHGGVGKVCWLSARRGFQIYVNRCKDEHFVKLKRKKERFCNY